MNQTYLRAHPADTRRVFPVGGNDPNTRADSPPPVRINASRTSSSPAPPTRPPRRPAAVPVAAAPVQRLHPGVLQYALRRRPLATGLLRCGFGAPKGEHAERRPLYRIRRGRNCA